MKRLALLLLALPCCARSVPPGFIPGGGVLVGDRIHFLAEQHVAGSEAGILVHLVCPTHPIGSTSSCVARRITFGSETEAAPTPATGPRSEATAAAEMDHHCTATVQSGDADTGFWLIVCGEQRFYRREAGTWVDRTP